jgi:uncharacterized protein (DUF4415 family)
MKKMQVNIPDEMPGDVSKLKGWTKAKQILDVGRVRLPTRRITINLDSDVVAIFKAEALKGGLPYQVAINQALREYLHAKEGQSREQAAKTVLAALEDPAVRKKIQTLASPRHRLRRAR